ncbi:MAG: Hsp20/alpha crystallin family protein [Treponemataceae bacterium]
MNALSFFNPRFTSDLFDVIDRNFSDLDSFGRHSANPRVDVIETKDSYILQMELPGFTENDISIEMKDRTISISSVKEAEKENKIDEEKTEKEETFLVRERFSSSFTRSFSLPNDIDNENVSAKFKNGLLSITIPRKQESKSQRIAIGE